MCKETERKKESQRVNDNKGEKNEKLTSLYCGFKRFQQKYCLLKIKWCNQVKATLNLSIVFNTVKVFYLFL